MMRSYAKRKANDKIKTYWKFKIYCTLKAHHEVRSSKLISVRQAFNNTNMLNISNIQESFIQHTYVPQQVCDVF